MSYNILEGGLGRIDPLAEVIRESGAEVAVLQETWDEGLFHKLADRLGMDRFLAENPKNPKGAVGLLTRWEIAEVVNHGVLDGRLTRSAFMAVLRKRGESEELAILGLHLHARETFEDEAVRLKEMEAVLEIAGGLRRPHVLAGDFNASHPDQLVDLAKLAPKRRQRIRDQRDQLPREVIKQVIAAGYVDTHAVGRSAEQFDTSFTTSYPAMRVDFVFASRDLAGRAGNCVVFKPEIARFASDHYPVLAEIDLA